MDQFYGQSLQTPSLSTVLLGFLCIIVWSVILRNTILIYKRYNKTYPPGPYPIPVIGNLLQLGSNPHRSLMKLAKVYGSVFSLQLGSRDLVVLNSYDSVKEALARKASQLAGRPPWFNIQAGSNAGRSIPFGDYSSRYVRNKKLALRALYGIFENPDLLQELVRHEIEQIKAELNQIQGTLVDPREMIKRSVLGITFRLVFGDNLKGGEQLRGEMYSMLDRAEEFIENSTAGVLLDFMPWLGFLLRKQQKAIVGSLGGLFAFIRKVHGLLKERDSREVASWCVASSLARIMRETKAARIKGGPRKPFDSPEAEDDELLEVDDGNPAALDLEDEISILADIFGAGLETVSTTLCWALAYLVTDEQVQNALREELDGVLQENQLLTLHNKSELPLLQATIEETLRLSTALPLAIPHCTRSRTLVSGYTIPKDTAIIVNLWAVNHDPKYFPEPEKFNPYR